MQFLILAILLIVSPLASASESTVITKVLDNGLTILVEPFPSSQSVAIYTYVKAGSVYETDCMGCGLSHYVEHMLFKGTPTRKPGDIPKEVKALGGVINAQTGFDDTVYTLDLPAINFEKGMDLIADMLSNPVFDAKEAEKERTVVHGEMRLYKDRAERKLSELVFKTAYLRHPYRHPIIGYQPLFDQITRDQLYHYYKKHYGPNNMILSISGGIDADEAIALAEKLFGNLTPQPAIERYVPQEQDIISPRIYYEEYPTDLYRVSYSFHSVPILDNDLYALDLLAKAMGQGESAILYERLYHNKHLVQGVSVSDYTPADKGLFEIEITLKDDKIKESIAEINEVLSYIKDKGLDPVQLSRTKKQMMVEYHFSSQRASQLAYRNAQDYAYTGDAKFSKNYADKMASITNDDIKRVVRKYLNPANSILVALVPKNTLAKKSDSTQTSTTEERKITLANGIPVILKPDAHVGVFSIYVGFRGGVREETPDNNGLGVMFTQNWTESVRGWPHGRFMKKLEENGISLGVNSGRNSLSVSINGVSGDETLALKMLNELVRSYDFKQDVLNQKKTDMLVILDNLKDNIDTVVSLELFKQFFGNHPYGLYTLGKKESVEKFTLKDLNTYAKHYIQPSNMMIAVTGNIDPVQIEKQLNQLFGTWKGPSVDLKSITDIKYGKAGIYPVEVEKEQAMISWAFPAPTMYAKDRYSLEILDGLLGAGLGGRLFNKIREEFGQAYTLGADYLPGLDTGIFTINVLTTQDKIDHVKTLVEAELMNIRQNAVSTEELNDLKNYLKGRWQMMLDTPAVMASTMLTDELYGLGYNNYTKYMANIDAVTVNDIQQAALTYLDPAKAVIVITKPKKSVEQSQ